MSGLDIALEHDAVDGRAQVKIFDSRARGRQPGGGFARLGLQFCCASQCARKAGLRALIGAGLGINFRAQGGGARFGHVGFGLRQARLHGGDFRLCAQQFVARRLRFEPREELPLERALAAFRNHALNAPAGLCRDVHGIMRRQSAGCAH